VQIDKKSSVVPMKDVLSRDTHAHHEHTCICGGGEQSAVGDPLARRIMNPQANTLSLLTKNSIEWETNAG
jgi:hypothetical protein